MRLCLFPHNLYRGLSMNTKLAKYIRKKYFLFFLFGGFFLIGALKGLVKWVAQ